VQMDELSEGSVSSGVQGAPDADGETPLEIRICCLPGEGLDPLGACSELAPG